MWNTSNLDMAFSPSRSLLPTLRNNGPFFSRAIPAAAIQACSYSSNCGWQGTSLALAALLVQP
jgi:hypothetical protein